MLQPRSWLVATTLLSSVLATACGSDPAPTNKPAVDAGNTDGGDGGAIDGSGDASATALPLMEVATGTMDLGQTECGGAASEAKSVTVKNVGTGALSVTGTLPKEATLADCTADKGACDKAAFKIALDPGGTATLKFAIGAAAKTAKAGDAIDAKVTLTSNDTAHASADIALHAIAAGGTVIASPATADFGVVPFGTTSDKTLQLHNNGNKTVTLDLALPENPQVTLGLPANVSPTGIVLAAGAKLDVSLSFKPTGAGSLSGGLKVTTTGATCGDSIANIAIAGESTIGAVGISTSSLDFGKVNCGATAPVQKVTLTNTGKAAYNFTTKLTLADKSGFTVAPDKGVVDAGKSVEVTLTAKAIPATAAITANGFGDTLAIGTDIPGDAPHLVELKETAQGAIFTFTQATVPFGKIPVSSTQSSGLTLTNAGNAGATVTLGSDNPVFAPEPISATVVAAGGNLPFTISFSPKDTTAQKGAVTVTVGAGEALCAPLPAGVQVSGQGTNGSVALSAQSLDFGATDCGKTAGAKKVTLTNSGNAPLKWTAILVKNPSPFALSQPSFGSLAAGQTVDITLTPNAIPQTSTTAVNAFGDSLTISTDVINDTPHVIALNQSAHGAILALNPTSLQFGDVPVTKTSMATFDVVNTGNAAASYKLTSDNAKFSVTGPVQVASAANSTLTATFAPTTSTAEKGKIALGVDATTVLCSPLPSALELTGTGTKGAITISPASLTFGNVNCGATAGPKTVTISNGGTAAFNLKTPVFGKSPAAAYVASLSATTVPAGGSVTLTVTPNAIPATSATTPNMYGDSLTVETDIVDDTAHVIAISETAQGAIFTVSTNTLSFSNAPVGTTSTTQFTVTNTGNFPTPVSFTVANPVFSIAGQTVQGNSSYFANAAFSPTAGQSYQDNATFTVPAGTPLCGALPATIAMSGKGVTGGVFVSPSALQFGYVACGAKQAAKQVTLKNGTGADFTWSAALNKGSGSAYVVNKTNGTVKAGDTLTLTVTPIAIPATSSTQADFFGDVLTVTTTAQGNETLTVPLHMTAFGAILSLTPSAIDFGLVKADKNSKSTNFSVVNTGNAQADVAIKVGNQNFSVSLGSSQVGGNGGAAQGSATFSPTSVGQHKATVELKTETGLCAPLPSGVDYLKGMGF